MSDRHIEAEQRLAELLGWTAISRMGNALIGTPPPGIRSIRGQALVPLWCRSWADCGPLMVKHRIAPAEYDQGDEAVRLDIVQKVIEKLEGENHGR